MNSSSQNFTADKRTIGQTNSNEERTFLVDPKDYPLLGLLFIGLIRPPSAKTKMEEKKKKNTLNDRI